MNKLFKGIFHTLKFMWVCRFSGVIDGGIYYLLKTVYIHKNANVTFSNLTIHALHVNSVFHVDSEHLSELKIDTTNYKVTKKKDKNLGNDIYCPIEDLFK